MREKIITQTKFRVKLLLNRKEAKKNLHKLKHARYMREKYSQQKKRLNLTFDLKDFEKIQKEASLIGSTPTAFLKNAVFAYFKNCRLPSKEAENEFSQLVFLLRNMANNLNQVARQANTVQKLSFHDFVQTKTILKNLEDTAEDFMKRV